jgi:ACT domain-containing protein
MSDSGDRQSYTIRLELLDRPGELRRALEPIAEHGGNLRSVFHERGNVTPRGHIPVEIDLKATPQQFETIVDALQETDVTIMQAGSQRYTEELTVLLVGHIVETDLSDTLSRIERSSGTSVRDVTLAAPEGTDGQSSARVHLATQSDTTQETLATVRDIVTEKDLRVIEPLPGGEGA